MFENTFAILGKILSDIKFAYHFTTLSTSFLYIAYLAYATITKPSQIAINLPLLVLVIGYTVFCIVNIKKRNNHAKTVKRIFKHAKLILNSCTLAFTIYSLYIATTELSAVSLILAIFMAIGWVTQLLLLLLNNYLQVHKELLHNAFQMDIEKITHPLEGPKKLFNKITGNVEPQHEESSTRKRVSIITEKNQKAKAERKAKKREQKRLEKEEKKRLKKENKI